MNIAEKIQTLYQHYGELDGISIECQKELIAIGITNKAARAEVFLQGAQVTGYQRHGEAPILFLSRDCQYKEGFPLRGGIPICWPWFGDLNKNNVELKNQFSSSFIESTSAHGFVRDVDWEISDIRIVSESLTVLVFEYDLPIDNVFEWPFAARLQYEVSIGESLRAALTIKNTGENQFSFSAALHSYFNVSNVEEATVTGLDNTGYIDALRKWEKYWQKGDVTFSQEVDRIYILPSNHNNIEVHDNDRCIKIVSSGSNSAVVWNPWVEKSKGLSQFCDNDYQKMVCVETANAAEDMVTLSANQVHILSVNIS